MDFNLPSLTALPTYLVLDPKIGSKSVRQLSEVSGVWQPCDKEDSCLFKILQITLLSLVWILGKAQVPEYINKLQKLCLDQKIEDNETS